MPCDACCLTLQQRLHHTLTFFDFARVQQTMQAVGWIWNPTWHPPTVDELRATAKRLLDGVALMPGVRRNSWIVSPQDARVLAGLEAEHHGGTLELRFVLATTPSGDCDCGDEE